MKEGIYEENLVMNGKDQRLRLIHVLTEVDGVGDTCHLAQVNWEGCAEGDFFSAFGYCFPILKQDVVAFFHVIYEDKDTNGNPISVRRWYAVIKEY